MSDIRYQRLHEFLRDEVEGALLDDLTSHNELRVTKDRLAHWRDAYPVQCFDYSFQIVIAWAKDFHIPQWLDQTKSWSPDFRAKQLKKKQDYLATLEQHVAELQDRDMDPEDSEEGFEEDEDAEDAEQGVVEGDED